MARLLSPAAFSILSWNLYFAPYKWATRMRHILAECERLQPDVVCFQEVLPPFLGLLQEPEEKGTTGTSTSSSTTSNNDRSCNSWLARNDYVSSTLDPQAVAPYGVLTLAKRKHRPRFQSVDLPTRMGRQLLLTNLESGGGERGGEEGGEGDAENGGWAIGNVHLESLDSADLRAEQLRKAGAILSGEEERKKEVVLCGDFNFCSERNYNIHDSSQPLENIVLPSALTHFQDLWPLMNKRTNEEKEGFTFDGTRNTLIDMPRPDPQMRYDRVMWKGAGRQKKQQQQQQQQREGQEKELMAAAAAAAEGGGWKPSDMRLVGTEPVEGALFLSDHFGLLAAFEREL